MNKTIEVIKDIRTLCTHIFEGGHRCASPALQREAFCYYHHPPANPSTSSARAAIAVNPSTSRSPPATLTYSTQSTKSSGVSQLTRSPTAAPA